MSKFVRKQRFETTFDGDTITAELQPLAYADMLALQSTGGEGKGEVAGFVNAARDIIPKYVNNLTGLTDSEGAAIGIDEVVGHVYFSELLRGLIGKLIEISQPPARPT